ncbi:hypothetical protein L6164_001681 [Bauhinia variegata]|uniref:Uncharacterized protein n=1 Tax=Bauhinia variegata TaxID=167791 RepID=A0ACB9QAU3_BAUVA|nr:hypothetical protein L6164_001681 [Bauhinia variegata]
MAASTPILPRVLIGSRRTTRKNKFIDFVGEYHLDLIVKNGAVPVIVPRVNGVHTLLEGFEPIHGVLLCEGQDIDPSLYDAELSRFSPEELEQIKKLHPSDTAIDKEKDLIELKLAKLCLERNIPYLGICRGSQVLNVSCGGTLYHDIEEELSKKFLEFQRVAHINYENYDEHRHLIKIMKETPLHHWFMDCLDEEKMEIMVNSYHHQGIKRLARRFVAMAFAPDGLVEGFYDPNAYNPEEGKFIMGLQFHPERMRIPDSDDFDYPGCPMAYQEFVKAVINYEKNLSFSACIPKALKLSEDLKQRRRAILESFLVARNIYKSGIEVVSNQNSELEAGAEFLQEHTALNLQQNRLKQVDATVRNGQKLRMNEEPEKLAMNVIGNMSVEQSSELIASNRLLAQICSESLEKKLDKLLQ